MHIFLVKVAPLGAKGAVSRQGRSKPQRSTNGAAFGDMIEERRATPAARCSNSALFPLLVEVSFVFMVVHF